MRTQENSQRCRSFEAKAGLPAGLALFPVSVVALGTPDRPVERLMGLQSAIAKGVHLATAIGQVPWRASFRELLRSAFGSGRLVSRHH
jgi:hypothetical protein